MSAASSPALREGALWGGAAALVLAAHLGGAMWFLHSARAATPPGLPEPVFVELAPLPEAAAPPEETEAPEMAEAAPEPPPEFDLAEPLPELEPIPDMNSLFPPPPDAVVLQRSERPKERPPEPEPEPEPRRVQKQPEPKTRETKRRASEEQQARKASTQLRAPQSSRTAAPQTQAGAASPRQVASWQSRVNAAVARHMLRTPLRQTRGQSVTITVSFSVDPSGRVGAVRVNGSSGDAHIDSALQRQASRLPRLPAPPGGRSVPIVLPVRLDL